MRQLLLGRCRFGDAGLTAFAAATEGGRTLPRLTVLSFASNRIGDPGSEALANALGERGLPKLEKLYMYSCAIGGLGMAAMALALEASGVPALVEADFSQNPGDDLAVRHAVLRQRMSGGAASVGQKADPLTRYRPPPEPDV